MELVVRTRKNRSSFLDHIFFALIFVVLKIEVAWICFTNNLVIAPADIWDAVPRKMRSKVLLEVRWLTQEFIETLPIPKLELYSGHGAESSGIPIMPRKAFQEFSGFITYSEIAKKSLKLSGAKTENVLVVPLWNKEALDLVNTVREPISENLLYVGRSAPDKRLDLAVDVARTLNVPIDIVGNYDQATIDWLKNQTCVNFIGSISHDKLIKLMESNSALLAPGAESWGLAVVEALQAGMEVYATQYTGVTEWITHSNLHKISEMNAELFVADLRKNHRNLKVSKIFLEFDFHKKWSEFLSERLK